MKKILILSPHLDDAVLSCGPYIITNSNKKNSVTIATVFSGQIKPNMLSPLAKWFHEICSLEDNAIEIRCAEDKNACSFLKTKCIHLNLPECLYRFTSDGSPRYIDSWEIYHTDIKKEMDTAAALQNILLKQLKINIYDEIFIPLGIGRHIDHLILRKAVEELINKEFLKECEIFYYQDIPYVCENIDLTWQQELTSNLSAISFEFPLKYFKIYIHAISLYKSQVKMLWNNKEEMQKKLKNCYQKTGAKSLNLIIWQ